MPLRGAQKGYRYQDIVSAFIVLKSLFDDDDSRIFQIDEKDKINGKISNNDIVDDLKIITNIGKFNFQIKYSKSGKKFSLDDLKSDGQLSIKTIIEYDKECKENTSYCFVLRWDFPTDEIKEWFIENSSQLFNFGLGKVYMFDKQKKQEIQTKLGLDDTSFSNIFNRLFFIIDSKKFSGDFYEIGQLESQMITAASLSGIGKFPNENTQPIDFCIKLTDWICNHRSSQTYNFTIKNMLEKMNVITDYGKLNQTFEVNESIFISQIGKYRDVLSKIRLNEKNLIIGEPGSGKTYFMHGFMNFLASGKINHTIHYLFKSVNDEDYNKRINIDYIIGNLFSNLLSIFPEFKLKYKTFNPTIDLLNDLINRINEEVFIFIDGIDHAYRNYNDVNDSRKIVDFLNKIKTNKYCHIVYISQPIVDLISTGFNKVELARWNYEECSNLIDKYGVFSENQKKIIFDKSKGNPLYLSYLCKSIDDIDNYPIYSGDIKDYYKYLETTYSKFAYLRYLAIIPFYFSKNDFVEITGLGNESIEVLDKVTPLLEFSPLFRGYKIYHESFKRYIYDRCIEEKITISSIQNQIINWLEKRDFYDEPKAYFCLFELYLKTNKPEEILKYAKHDFLVSSVYCGYTTKEIRNNLELVKNAACNLESFDGYTKYLLLSKSLDAYQDEDFPFYDSEEFFRMFLAIKDAEGLNMLLKSKNINAKTQNSILLSAAFNGIEINKRDIYVSVEYNQEYESNKCLMLHSYCDSFNKDTICLKSDSSLPEIIDIYYILEHVDRLSSLDYSSNNTASLYLNSNFFEKKSNVSIDSFDFLYGDNVFKFDFSKKLLEFCNYVLEKNNAIFAIKKFTGRNYNFFESLLCLISKNQLAYFSLVENGNLDSYENSTIENLKEFIEKASPFKGNPRACDFTSRIFRDIFLRQLFKPLSLFKIRITEYVSLILDTESKLHTTVRGCNMGCISIEDILRFLTNYNNLPCLKSVLSLLEKQVEKDSYNQIYTYSSSNYMNLAYLFLKIDKRKANEYFKKAISYSFCYGQRKDIFFSDVLDSFDYGLELNNDFRKYSIDLGNMAYSLFYHTDGSGTSNYFNVWLSIYGKNSKNEWLSYIVKNQFYNPSWWVIHESLGDLLELIYRNIPLKTLVNLLVTNYFTSSDLNYDVIIFALSQTLDRKEEELFNALYNYLVTISKQMPGYLTAKINELLKKEETNVELLQIPELLNKESSHEYLNTSVLDDLTNDLFIKCESLRKFNKQSIYDFLKNNDFTSELLDKLIQIFSKYYHEIDILDDFVFNNELNQNKKMYLYVLYYAFRTDGWYKRFVKPEALNLAYEINQDETIKFLFYIFKKSSNPFHGYSNLANPSLRINNKKDLICKAIIDYSFEIIPDCQNYLSDFDNPAMLNINDDIDLLLISKLNDLNLDVHSKVMLLIENEFNNCNDKFIDLVIGCFHDLNNTSKLEILSLFRKCNFPFSRIQKTLESDSNILIKALAKNFRVPFKYEDIFVSNDAKFESYKNIYDYEILYLFCIKFELNFNEFDDEFRKVNTSEEVCEKAKSLYSRASKNIIDHYLTYETFLIATSNVLSMFLEKCHITLEHIGGLVLCILDKLQNSSFKINNDFEKEGLFEAVSECNIERTDRKDSEESIYNIKHVFCKCLNGVVDNNVLEIINGLFYNPQFLLRLNKNFSSTYEIEEHIVNGVIKYYQKGNLIGFLSIEKTDFDNISESYGRFYKKESIVLYLSCDFLKESKLQRNEYDIIDKTYKTF